MKTLVLTFCVALCVLISCKSSSETTNITTIDAKTTIVGRWAIHYANGAQSDITATLGVSGDKVTGNGATYQKSSFSGSNFKFTVEAGDTYQIFDATFSDNNNFSGTYSYGQTGTAGNSTTVTGVRKQ